VDAPTLADGTVRTSSADPENEAYHPTRMVLVNGLCGTGSQTVGLPGASSPRAITRSLGGHLPSEPLSTPVSSIASCSSPYVGFPHKTFELLARHGPLVFEHRTEREDSRKISCRPMFWYSCLPYIALFDSRYLPLSRLPHRTFAGLTWWIPPHTSRANNHGDSHRGTLHHTAST